MLLIISFTLITPDVSFLRDTVRRDSMLGQRVDGKRCLDSFIKSLSKISVPFSLESFFPNCERACFLVLLWTKEPGFKSKAALEVE